MLRWLLFVLASWCGLAHAHPAVDTLLAGPLPPAEELAAIDTLVAADVSPDELAPLFGADLHRSVAIAGAHVVERRLRAGSTAEASLAWQTFLSSKLSLIAHDPDVFERVLWGLQQADPSVLAALPGSEPEGIADRAWGQVHDDLLTRLEPSTEWPRPPTRLEPRTWTERLLAGGHPLVRLQTDSGDAAYRLMEELQVASLVALIDTQPEPQARVAFEAAKQRFPHHPQPWDAARRRGMGSAEHPPPSGGLPPRLRPRRDLADISLSGDLRVETTPATVSPWWLAALLPVLWLAAVRAFPDRRKALFRLGAIGLGLGLLVATEGVLALLGVEPLLTSRPQLYSYRSDAQPGRGEAFAPLGDAHAAIADGRARFRVFPVEPDRPRIVVLGESSAHGSNHLTEETFAARLGVALDADVINASIGGGISDEITAIGQESLDYAPDVLVLYFGFNDLTRLVAISELRAFGPNRLRLREVLDRSRLVRVVSEVVPEAWLQVAPEDTFLATDSAPIDSDHVRQMHEVARRHAARNIRRLIRAATDRGVDVVVAVQALNAETLPTASDHPSDPSVQLADQLRGIALDATAGTDLAVVDVPAALRQHAGGPAGDDYFWDGVHPSRLGHAVIAAALEPTLRETLRKRSAR